MAPQESGQESDIVGDDHSGNTEESKMGKHILVEEKRVKYEPKIVAEAIRTMISRDND